MCEKTKPEDLTYFEQVAKVIGSDTVVNKPKFTDLDKKYQYHFAAMLEKAGYPPEDATHVDFDMGGVLDCERWLKIEDGEEYFLDKEERWLDASENCVESEENYPIPQKPWYDPADVAFKEGCLKDQKKPTGGKSSYYLVEIPLDAPTLEIDEENGVVRFMLEEYIRYGLGNDFDRGNIAKANHRLGNKPGVAKEYDLNKINHYVDRINTGK